MSPRLTVARLPAKAGLGWLAEGFAWMRAAPMQWLGLSSSALLALLLLNLFPMVGGIFSMLLTPFWVAGFMAASRDASQGRWVTVQHLAIGFKTALQPLLVIAIVYLAGSLLIGQWLLGHVAESLHPILSAMHSGQDMHGAMRPEDAAQMAAHAEAALPSLLTALLLMLPLLMATWFAPALVLFNGFTPWRALWWSLWAVAVNPVASLLYGLVLAGIWGLALILPLGLGLLLAFPWAMASTYAAYRTIFHEPAPAANDFPSGA
jgi:uncharacterized membrane protein